MKKEWVKIGEISVDAGIIWIGDPCYIRNNYFLPWHAFCDLLPHNGEAKQFDEGLCIPSGYGDGRYSVYARYGRDGVIQEVKVDFTGEEDQDE